MKFFIIADTHFSASPSRWRVDDVMATQKAEMDEIAQIANEKNADMILHAGDAFHIAKSPHSITSLVLDWGRKLNKPFYILPGNHDLTGLDLISLPYTALGTLFSSGIFTQLTELVLEQEKIVIRGIPCYSDPMQGDYVFDSRWDEYTKIILTHNFLSPDPLPFPYAHPDQIKTNANFVFAGHLHSPWSYETNSTIFRNVGAISRWPVNERQRIPTVAILDIMVDGFGIEYVQLKTDLAKWDLEGLKEENAKEMNLNQFVESLESTEFENLDIMGVVQQAALTQNITSDILNVCLEKIERAKQELQ